MTSPMSRSRSAAAIAPSLCARILAAGLILTASVLSSSNPGLVEWCNYSNHFTSQICRAPTECQTADAFWSKPGACVIPGLTSLFPFTQAHPLVCGGIGAVSSVPLVDRITSIQYGSIYMWRDYNSYLWITLTLDGLPDTQPYLPFEAPWNGVPASASLSISILGQFDPKLPTGYYDTFPLGLFGKFTCSSFALDLRSVCDPYSSVYIPGNFINLAQCRCTNGNYCPPMDLSASDKLYVSVQAEVSVYRPSDNTCGSNPTSVTLSDPYVVSIFNNPQSCTMPPDPPPPPSPPAPFPPPNPPPSPPPPSPPPSPSTPPLPPSHNNYAEVGVSSIQRAFTLGNGGACQVLQTLLVPYYSLFMNAFDTSCHISTTQGPSGFQSNVAFRIFFAQPDGAVEYLYQTLNSVSIWSNLLVFLNVGCGATATFTTTYSNPSILVCNNYQQAENCNFVLPQYQCAPPPPGQLAPPFPPLLPAPPSPPSPPAPPLPPSPPPIPPALSPPSPPLDPSPSPPPICPSFVILQNPTASFTEAECKNLAFQVLSSYSAGLNMAFLWQCQVSSPTSMSVIGYFFSPVDASNFMAHFTSPIVAQAVLSNYLPTRNPGAACGSSFVANAVCNDIFDIPRVEFNSSNLPFLFCPPPPPDLVPLPPSPPPRPPSPQTSSPNPPSPPPPNPPPSPFPPPLSGAVSIQIYGGEEALLGYCKSFLNTLSYFFRLSNKFPLTPATCFQVGTFSMVEATFANYDDAQYFTATLTSNMLFFVRTAGIPCGCSLVTAAPESLPIIQECSGQLPDLCCKPPPPGSLNPPPAPPPEDSVYTLIVEPPISIDGQIIEKIDLESVMCDRLRNGFEKFIRYTGVNPGTWSQAGRFKCVTRGRERSLDYRIQVTLHPDDGLMVESYLQQAGGQGFADLIYYIESLCGSIIKWQPKGKRAMPLNYLFPAIAKNPDLAYCLHGLQLQEP